MSIQTELNRIKNASSAVKNAIKNIGGKVTYNPGYTTNINDYATALAKSNSYPSVTNFIGHSILSEFLYPIVLQTCRLLHLGSSRPSHSLTHILRHHSLCTMYDRAHYQTI